MPDSAKWHWFFYICGKPLQLSTGNLPFHFLGKKVSLKCLVGTGAIAGAVAGCSQNYNKFCKDWSKFLIVDKNYLLRSQKHCCLAARLMTILQRGKEPLWARAEARIGQSSLVRLLR